MTNDANSTDNADPTDRRIARSHARRHTRRRFLALGGAAGAVALAGCSAEPTDGAGGDDDTDGNDSDGDDAGDADGDDGTEDDEEAETSTLTVATYGAFIDAPSVSPGEWLKEEFESRVDARLEWATPDNEVNHYVERASSGASIDADVYVGLTTEDLVRVDEELDDDLFAEAGDIGGLGDVRDGLRFDPFERAVPYDTGYVSLVYDGTEMEAPETFDGLLDDEYAGDLIAQNPGGSATGRAFLLHTIHRFGDGEDGEVAGGDDDPAYDYLDYWADLQANDVRVLGSWEDAYTSWSEGEAPMVVSYSTDQVFAADADENLEEHQIRFLNDQAYATPEGMALFADADEPELAREFMSFMLEPEVQGEIAQRNVAFPATDTATLPDDYAQLAYEPAEPVTFTYDELQGSVSEWITAWERQFAGN